MWKQTWRDRCRNLPNVTQTELELKARSIKPRVLVFCFFFPPSLQGQLAQVSSREEWIPGFPPLIPVLLPRVRLWWQQISRQVALLPNPSPRPLVQALIREWVRSELELRWKVETRGSRGPALGAQMRDKEAALKKRHSSPSHPAPPVAPVCTTTQLARQTCIQFSTPPLTFIFQKIKSSLAVSLNGLRTGLQTKGSPVQFPVRAHAWVAGQVPSREHARNSHTLIFPSLSPCFLLSPKINK